MYDIVIIGAGPAGISAGIYAVSRGKKTLIIEKHRSTCIQSGSLHFTAIPCTPKNNRQNPPSKNIDQCEKPRKIISNV